MSNKNPKFIIEKGEFKMGRVGYHVELSSNEHNVTGGGWFHIDEKSKSLYLYGSSFDFGEVTRSELAKALAGEFKNKEAFKGFFVWHSTFPHRNIPDFFDKVIESSSPIFFFNLKP